MNAKEYLKQAYRLDQRINSDIEEAKRLRELAASISSPSWGEKVSGSRPTDPPFVHNLIKAMDLERTINEEVNTLIALKNEVHQVIDTVTNIDERMILRYRYIHNSTWDGIATALHVDVSTVYRWHSQALKHVTLPKNPITI